MEEFRFYRVNYLGKTYEFKFQYSYTLSYGYRAYIEKAPSYAGRKSSGSATHRNKDGERYYICWSERIRTRKKMDAVVALWSKATVMYIVSGGESIDSHAKRVMQAL